MLQNMPVSRRLFSILSVQTLSKVAVASIVCRELSSWGGAIQASAAESEQDSKGSKKSTSSTSKAIKPSSDEINYLRITEAEWKKRLTAPQFEVARKHGTERAYSGKYHHSKNDGVYRCVCCKAEVFDSKHKFDSGTGWPSFWQPYDEKIVGESADNKLGYPRIEIHCTRCNAHLGHVFEDAPKTPTGLRYCINSVCLVFVPRKEFSEPAADR